MPPRHRSCITSPLIQRRGTLKTPTGCSSRALKYRSRAHTSRHAHGYNPVSFASPAHLPEQGRGEAGAGRTQGVSERDSPAVWIDLGGAGSQEAIRRVV